MKQTSNNCSIRDMKSYKVFKEGTLLQFGASGRKASYAF